MIELPVSVLNFIRKALKLSFKHGVFMSMSIDYEVDKLIEEVEETLSTFDKKVEKLRQKHFVTEDNLYLYIDNRTKTSFWFNPNSGQFFGESGGEKIAVSEYKVTTPEGNEVNYLDQYGEPSFSDLSPQFESKDQENIFEEKIEKLQEKTECIELYTVDKDEWTQEGAIDMELLVDLDRQFPGNLRRLLRYVLVDGEEEKLREIGSSDQVTRL